jgi:hypothetical protein
MGFMVDKKVSIDLKSEIVRKCQTKTLPCVEKKDLLKYRLLGCPSQVQGAAA